MTEDTHTDTYRVVEINRRRNRVTLELEEGVTFRLPINKLKFSTAFFGAGDDVTVTMPAWLARKEGLIAPR